METKVAPFELPLFLCIVWVQGFKVWFSEAYRHTLQQADIEAELVPFDRGSLDANEREADRRLPLLRRLEDEVVERLADPAMEIRDE